MKEIMQGREGRGSNGRWSSRRKIRRLEYKEKKKDERKGLINDC